MNSISPGFHIGSPRVCSLALEKAEVLSSSTIFLLGILMKRLVHAEGRSVTGSSLLLLPGICGSSLASAGES